MRIISGTLKGRIIKGDKIKGTRPTMDRLKESLFAMLQDHISDSICLDLFAGTGALGIEAISNGAKFCYFVDHGKEAYNTIVDNLKTFGIANAQTFMWDYMKALRYFADNHIKFDIIFLDPPYKENCIPEVLKFIDNNNLLYSNGQIICEITMDNLSGEYNNFKMVKDRKYGDKQIKIYMNEC